jgi:hypothetical protein
MHQIPDIGDAKKVNFELLLIGDAEMYFWLPVNFTQMINCNLGNRLDTNCDTYLIKDF